MGPPAAHASFSRLYGCKPAFRGVLILAAIVTVAAALYDDAQVAQMMGQIIRAARKDPTLSEAAIMESFAQSSASASEPEVLKEAETGEKLALSLAVDTPLEAAMATALTGIKRPAGEGITLMQVKVGAAFGPVSAQPSCHITMAGRNNRIGTFPPQCTNNSDIAAVRCCDNNGNGYSMTLTGGCQTLDYQGAVAHCANSGYRLCTQSEMAADQTKGSGCDFDNKRTWTSTQCTHTWPRDSAKCNVTSQAFTDCIGSFDSSCAHGVGVDSPFKIPDEAITTNALREDLDWSAVPSLARLGNTGLAWIAATDSPADYVEYDLGELRIIAAMKAQGADHTNCGKTATTGGHVCPTSVIRKFKLVYSRDGTSWLPLTMKIGEAATEFTGPLQDGNIYSKTDNEPEEYTFPSTDNPGLVPFEARYVRVYLVQAALWGKSSIQVEFYGPRCQADGLVPVGIASMAIPDTAMTENETYAGKRHQAPSDARLHSLNYFEANWKGYLRSPAGYGFRTQLWVQVDMGNAVSVGAVATDKSPDTLTEYKLGGSLDGTTFTMQTDILHAQSETMTKHYLEPFSARYVRLYPWDGSYRKWITFRMELYAVVSTFQWRDAGDSPRLGDHTSAGAIGSDAFCNLTMLDLAPSFQSWTEGMHGDGNIYKSETSQIELGGTDCSVTAFQRSTSKFLGMMRKQLVCFVLGNQEKCCVSKHSNPLGRGAWQQQAEEIKMS